MASANASTQHSEPGASPDNVSLRIIILAQGTSRENDLHLVVPLDLTVRELKERLTQLLVSHPGSDSQRLIYQGRPLLDNDASLRSLLRLQSPQNIPITAHVLHLVIRPDQHPASAVPTPNQPNSRTSSTPTSPPPNVPHPALQHAVFHQPPNVLPPGMGPPQFAQMMMQQHMAMHNQHLANAQHAHDFPGMPPIPGPLAPQNLPNVQFGVLGQGQPPGMAPAGIANQAPAQAPNIPQATMTVRVEETILPNGQRIRTVTNTGVPHTVHQQLHPLQPNPVERSASAPGSAERPSTPSPLNGMGVRGRPAGMASHGFPLPTPPIQIGRPAVSPLNPQSAPQNGGSNPLVWLLSSPTGPQALLFAPGHGYFSSASTNRHGVAQTHSATHSGPISPAGQSRADSSAQPGQNVHQDQAPNAVPAQPGAQLVLRPQAEGPGQAPAGNAAREQNGNAGDLAAFILQRGWLFLRLYMFIFVFSESGTWRRIILLGLAIIVSLLPQENVLYDLVVFARQRFEALIGPPEAPQRQPPPRDQPQAADAGQTNEAANRRQDGGNAPVPNQQVNGMPTPEEHARRLLRERRAQDQSYIRSILQPFEQAAALFLASLIPGVGERHVQAREAARRLVAEEEERLRRESEEERSRQQANETSNQDGQQASVGAGDISGADGIQATASTSAAEGTSTGVAAASSSNPNAPAGSGQELRQRNTDGQPPPNLVADW